MREKKYRVREAMYPDFLQPVYVAEECYVDSEWWTSVTSEPFVTKAQAQEFLDNLLGDNHDKV